MRQIKIREMHPQEARQKLEDELNGAFMRGETRVEVLHGIGTGTIKKITLEVAASLDFVRIPENQYGNAGITFLDLMPPDKTTMRRIRHGY